MIVSVRNLVEFVLRSGSIDSRYMSAGRAQDGTKIHQRIQKHRKNEAALLGGVLKLLLHKNKTLGTI